MSDVKTYPFDLKRALAGDAVCAVSGKTPVLDLTEMRARDGKTLVGIHDGDVCTWWPTGEFHHGRKPSGLDLRMVTDGGPTLVDELVAALTAIYAGCVNSVSDGRVTMNVSQEAFTAMESALAKAGAL